MSEMLMKPEWLKIKPKADNDFSKIKNALRKRGLVTVCEEAHCPNMAECWHNEGTATFMVMGDTCTRGCQFCAIKTRMRGQHLDPFEPAKLASAIAEMELDYAVITSVTRDDLIDGGSSHFANCIIRIKKERPETKVEVLIPDFQGQLDAIRKVVNAKPDVIAHNIETVKSLQRKVRDLRANYDQSLNVLRIVKSLNPEIYTKSAIMVGVGETKEEIIQAMKDLRAIGCDILTIGQYMKPKNMRMKVVEYAPLELFEEYKRIGEELGFIYVASGPFVRSSYRAGELFMKGLLEKK
jgi:lipoic acid synthetase